VTRMGSSSTGLGISPFSLDCCTPICPDTATFSSAFRPLIGAKLPVRFQQPPFPEMVNNRLSIQLPGERCSGLHFWPTACSTCIQIMTGASEAAFKPTEVRTQKGRVLSVRAYSDEDFEPLVEMYAGFEPKRVAQGLPPPDVPRITHWLQQLQGKSHSLLAFDGKKIVAHTILCPIRQTEIEFTIFVHQDYREETLGTAMSARTLAWSLDMGFSKVFLTTEFSNYRAIGLFRKIGFHTSSSYGDECEMVIDLLADSKAQAA